MARDARQWNQAHRLYAKYLNYTPHDSAIWVQYGHALKESGDLRSAGEAYSRSIRLQPDVADTHLQVGHLLKLQGHKSDALAAYERALKLEPTLADAVLELGALLAEPAAAMDAEQPAIREPPPLLFDELDKAAKVYHTGTESGGPWDEFRGRFLGLPSWFNSKLDPLSEEYRLQQLKLWQAVSGISTSYRAKDNELTGGIDHFDSIRRPGFYAGATETAGDHLIALGHIVKRSGLSAGDWVLEYGAGFGQIALTFARLGISVDTVDVDPAYCAAITKQSRFFNVNLTAFQGEFGLNPREGHKYNLILFYEAFHHCLDFLDIIGKLRNYLKPEGKIMLAGEPIVGAAEPAVPYPWGIRLDAEAVAVVRARGWLELGFRESFLAGQFICQGFVWRPYPGIISHYATLHEFRQRPYAVRMAAEPPVI